jgi:hypothetical protein
MTRHCDTCTCEDALERKQRLEREHQTRLRAEREQEFVRCHSVLTDDELDWAREQLAKARHS